MASHFNALQIGGRDLDYLFENHTKVNWDYFDTQLFDFESGYLEKMTEVLEQQGHFDLVFIQTPFVDEMVELLQLICSPYNTIVDEKYWDEAYRQFDEVQMNNIKPIQYDNEEMLHDKLQAIAFPGQYGDKVSPAEIDVHDLQTIDVTYRGHIATTLKGDFGDTFKPIVSWKNQLVYDEKQVIEVWPEFRTEGDVELEYVFRIVSLDPAEEVIETYVLTEEQLQQPLYLKRRPTTAFIAISVRARLQGTIHLGAVHKRFSRIEFGHFLLGGERFVDEHREEFFYYFHPGDLQPPLNVYFSGYHRAEGFEAYFLMRKLGAPFLLISDPRLEGGAFYLGSTTFEQGIQDVIRQTLVQLGFEPHECIFSGLSMGSFGALYYGAKMNPKCINIGKPLVNVGSVANNMKLLRPNDFETSLDIALSHQPAITYSDDAIQSLNKRFWDVFSNQDMRDTAIAVTYMIHDDYDRTAFDDLLSVVSLQNVYMMNKAIPGRHNDDTETVVNWFMHFYRIFLKEQFRRE